MSESDGFRTGFRCSLTVADVNEIYDGFAKIGVQGTRAPAKNPEVRDIGADIRDKRRRVGAASRRCLAGAR